MLVGAAAAVAAARKLGGTWPPWAVGTPGGATEVEAPADELVLLWVGKSASDVPNSERATAVGADVEAVALAVTLGGAVAAVTAVANGAVDAVNMGDC